MKITSNQMLKFLNFLAWLLFILISITAGRMILGMIYVAFVNPANAATFWPDLDLSALYDYNRLYFYTETALMAIVNTLEAALFYVIRFLGRHTFNLERPFQRNSAKFVFNLSYLSSMIGGFSLLGAGFAEWLRDQGISLPQTQELGVAGGDVWLFMAIILFVIAHIFKKGIEIQEENELTV